MANDVPGAACDPARQTAEICASRAFRSADAAVPYLGPAGQVRVVEFAKGNLPARGFFRSGAHRSSSSAAHRLRRSGSLDARFPDRSFCTLDLFSCCRCCSRTPPLRKSQQMENIEEPQRVIYYQIPKNDPFEKLPRITPAGEGGQPGAGEIQALLQKIGSTTTARKIVIVSKPVRPDNKRQTIYQPATPPDLHIDMDLKLPNIVGGPTVPVAKPQVHLNANSRPNQTHQQATKAVAPTIAALNAAIPTNLPAATVANPHLAVPLNESRPRQAQVVIGQATAPSLSDANVATATNLGDTYRTGEPTAPAAPPSDAEAPGGSKASKNDPIQIAGDGKGVVVIGLDPAEAAALVNLPPGNRWGDFTIAPGGGQPGAVGGSENGVPNAGSTSTGGGGDRVPGVGPGFAGGGGGNSGASGNLSISGEPGATGQDALDATRYSGRWSIRSLPPWCCVKMRLSSLPDRWAEVDSKYTGRFIAARSIRFSCPCQGSLGPCSSASQARPQSLSHKLGQPSYTWSKELFSRTSRRVLTSNVCQFPSRKRTSPSFWRV